MATLTLSPDFGWCILVASGISAQCILTGFSVMKVRKQYGLNYPDMGNGRYSAKLTDDQWLDFNNHQRAHHNYVEGVASVITLELLSGLFYPKYAAAMGATYMLGRYLYASGYQKKGSDGRKSGAIILDIALLGLFGASIAGALKFMSFI